MPRLTLILTLFLAADVSINRAFADIDLQNILQALQLQQQDEQSEHVKQSYQHHRYKNDDDNRFGSLKPQEVQTLIQEALQDRDEASVQGIYQQEPYIYKNKRPQSLDNNRAADNLNMYALWQGINNEQDDQMSDSRAIEKLFSQQEPERKKKKKSLKNYQGSYLDHLNQLLSLASDEDNKQQRYQSHQAQHYKQRQRLNDLLGNSNYPETANRADADLDKYSKIYVILNVDAVNTSQNQNRLKDLVSSLLDSTSSSQRDRRESKKAPSYKGFLVHRGSRKANGEEDSDMDYKPKRPRAHDSGRTPIPYIRHRGDIYEKEQ